MAGKLKNAPLFYTIVQIRFNPIVQMKEYIPKIQDQLRRGYPDFQTENIVSINIKNASEVLPQEIQNFPVSRWSFSNAERNEGYLLLSDSLTFHTTQYDSFDEFKAKALNGLKIVNEIVDLSFIESVGLRYLDAISPENDSFDNILTPSLIGLYEQLGGTHEQTFSETVVKIDGGQLVARAVITHQGVALPPDLYPLHLTVPTKITALSGKNATLDIDYFVHDRFNFDIKKIEAQLLASHDIITKAFHKSVTTYAINTWKEV